MICLYVIFISNWKILTTINCINNLEVRFVNELLLLGKRFSLGDGAQPLLADSIVLSFSILSEPTIHLELSFNPGDEVKFWLPIRWLLSSSSFLVAQQSNRYLQTALSISRTNWFNTYLLILSMEDWLEAILLELRLRGMDDEDETPLSEDLVSGKKFNPFFYLNFIFLYSTEVLQMILKNNSYISSLR